MIKDSSPKAALKSYADSSGKLAIDVHSLYKTYTEGLVFRSRFQALSDVSFNVRRGEVYGLLGPNGAGKTTFIKILLGIIRKTAGDATMMGHPAGSRTGRQLVGYLPEHLRIPDHLTANSALECYGNLSNVSNAVVRQRRDRLLEMVGLSDRAKDRCKKYSKGMLQRLGLAQAMLHEPKMLILDEPTDGLDPQARADVRQIIGRLKEEGVTIFLNSHILQEVEMICDRVAILNRGELRYNGEVSAIGEFVQQMSGEKESGVVIEIEVVGPPDAVNAAFGGQSFEIKSREGEDGFNVELTVSGQAAIDGLVDSLRSNGVSIRKLSLQQVTLEDAFLKIVTK